MVDVAEVAVEGQRAPEVVECVGVLAGAVGDVAEGIEHVCGARRMVSAERRERGVAVLPGFVVSTEQSRAPAHRIERICFPYWVPGRTEQIEGLRGVRQRQLVVARIFVHD